MARIRRYIARTVLLAMLVVSLGSLVWSALRIANDPLLRPVIERGADEFAAALEREMAEAATTEAITSRIRLLLAETPRNWIAIQALEDLAAERALPLPPDLIAERAVAWDEDSGWLAMTGGCLTCTFDASTCSLSMAMVCNVPVAMTPVGDLVGLGKAAADYIAGREIDQLDLALSIVGIGATLATVATGGTSYTLKAGASLLRLARKMSLLPPRLLALVTDVARTGIRWDELAAFDTLADPARLIVADRVAPLASVASDLGRISAKLDSSRTLHLLRHIDGPDDARRIATATERLGSRVVGALELLGKSRFMRLSLRMADEAWALAAGIAGSLLSLGAAVTSLLQSLLFRRMRRVLWRAAR